MAPHSIHPQSIIHNHFPDGLQMLDTCTLYPHPGRKRGKYRPVLLYPQGHSSPGSSTLKSPATHGHSKHKGVWEDKSFHLDLLTFSQISPFKG